MSQVEKILPHIATIHDLDKGLENSSTDESLTVLRLAEWTIRMAARCIVIDPKTKRIALQALDTEGVTKIPGGGLQYDSLSAEGENFEKGVVREIAEEIGVDANKMKLESLGMVIEYRTEWQLSQISHCYVGHISEQESYDAPLEEGSHLVWADTISHAIDLVQANDTDTYDKRFMKMRDIAILEYYKSTTATEV
jgi:ADP-ribose pyrophosphatase YjhB (NUDIX family)